MDTQPKPRPDRYTYGDYLKWPDEERWELIEGQAYDMTPPPTIRHQLIQAELGTTLGIYFRGKPCRLLFAPTDVLMPSGGEGDEEVDTVLQPDLLVVCDATKMDDRRVRGGPDLVIEILSKSTVDRDMGVKLQLYEKHGVRCYLVVDPWSKTLTVRYLGPGGTFGRPEIASGADRLPIRIFDGLVIDLPVIFA